MYYIIMYEFLSIVNSYYFRLRQDHKNKNTLFVLEYYVNFLLATLKRTYESRALKI